ncbi:MAG: hypothetical protein FRX49_04623 [Trebouxia sp. A1-2]|nr:MAG: hypothetical protein FRX49_04623 [Trebouxia sp. A1-2]
MNTPAGDLGRWLLCCGLDLESGAVPLWTGSISLMCLPLSCPCWSTGPAAASAVCTPAGAPPDPSEGFERMGLKAPGYSWCCRFLQPLLENRKVLQ